MGLDLDPADGRAQAALDHALSLASIELDPGFPGYASPWRVAALAESVERDPRADESYAPSPRSTRGATRA